MNASSPKLFVVASVTLLTLLSPLPAAEQAVTGESDDYQSNPADFKSVDKAKRTQQRANNRTQLANDAIDGVDEPSAPERTGFDKPLSSGERRDNDIHFLKANQKDERQKLSELKALQQLMKDRSEKHRSQPSTATLDQMMKIDKQIDRKLKELEKRQRELERLNARLDRQQDTAETERRRQQLRALSQALVNQAFWQLHGRQQGHGQEPSQSGHHAGGSGR